MKTVFQAELKVALVSSHISEESFQFRVEEDPGLYGDTTYLEYLQDGYFTDLAEARGLLARTAGYLCKQGIVAVGLKPKARNPAEVTRHLEPAFEAGLIRVASRTDEAYNLHVLIYSPIGSSGEWGNLSEQQFCARFGMSRQHFTGAISAQVNSLAMLILSLAEMQLSMVFARLISVADKVVEPKDVAHLKFATAAVINAFGGAGALDASRHAA